MNEKQIAKEILLKLLEQGAISFEDYPDAKSFVEVTTLAFKEIYKAVDEV